ncbi:50S ribosomal protein L25 [Candidatus Nomurabacteria bacterium]|jgi:large subunit ribosomal protein L25|nr:MAG: 50S ribosomal protein L25 [Candidatus Nomurabacteria bacterium]
MFTLQVSKRAKNDNVDAMRKGEIIPAVFYGFNKETTSISVDAKAFKKVWKGAGESSQVTLETPDGNVETIIHDLQFDPVTGNPIHVDFLAIDTNKAITVDVPLEFDGVSEAVKGGLGNLVKVLHEVSISALPKDLPHALHIDISSLSIVGDQIHIKNIAVPPGVTIINEVEEVVALIAAMVEEKEEEAPVDLSTIEVEKKGKKEEDAVASEETAPAA